MSKLQDILKQQLESFSTMSVTMDIGNKIRVLREQKGLSQQDLADLINEGFGTSLKRNSISDYEKGKTEPKTSILKRIVDIFDTTFEYLYDQVSKSDMTDQSASSKSLNEPTSGYGITEKINDYKSSQQEEVFSIIKRNQEIRSLLKDDKITDQQDLNELLKEMLDLNEKLSIKVMDLYEKNIKAIDFINNQTKR